jgi:hypothetical protein
MHDPPDIEGKYKGRCERVRNDTWDAARKTFEDSSKIPQLQPALDGRIRDHHRFLLDIFPSNKY